MVLPLAALQKLESGLKHGEPEPSLTDEARRAILEYPPADTRDYRLARIAEWTRPRYVVDRRFTRLTQMLDHGPELGRVDKRSAVHRFHRSQSVSLSTVVGAGAAQSTIPPSSIRSRSV